MLSVSGLFIAVLTALPCALIGQNAIAPAPAAPAPAAVNTVAGVLRPALDEIAGALATLNIRRWRAPNSVRGAAEGDVASIQRDMNGTLAGLLDQAGAAPGSIPAAFAVYRNVDALYDTLLRVVETAELSAPDPETVALENALKNLETARANLGDRILNGAQVQQAELTRLRTVIAAAAAVQRAPAKTIVVDDGPVRSKEHRENEARRKHHVVRKKPAPPVTSTQQKTAPQ